MPRFGELSTMNNARVSIGAGSHHYAGVMGTQGAGADTMADVAAPVAPANRPAPMMADQIWANWPQWEMQHPGAALAIRLIALVLGVSIQVAIIYFAAKAGAKAAR